MRGRALHRSAMRWMMTAGLLAASPSAAEVVPEDQDRSVLAPDAGAERPQEGPLPPAAPGFLLPTPKGASGTMLIVPSKAGDRGIIVRSPYGLPSYRVSPDQ